MSFIVSPRLFGKAYLLIRRFALLKNFNLFGFLLSEYELIIRNTSSLEGIFLVTAFATKDKDSFKIILKIL